MRHASSALFALTLLLTGAWIACGGGGASTPTIPTQPSTPSLVSISVTGSSASVACGLTVQLTATGKYSDNTSKDLTASVNWTSSDTTKLTVNSAGLATAKATGNANVAASSGAISSGNFAVTVTAPTVSSISVAPGTASIVAGTSQQFTATATYSDATTGDVTSTANWTSSSTSVARVSQGLATSFAPGQATITASVGSVSNTAALTVTAATLASLSVTPNSASFGVGATQQFTAIARKTDNTTQDVTATATWTTADPSVASVSGGLVQALLAGTTTVTATSGSLTATASVTVNAPTLTNLLVLPATATIASGQTQQYSALAVYSDASTQEVTSQVAWDTSNHAVATVSAAGLCKGLSAGAANVTATMGAVSASVPMTVTSATLVQLDVSPDLPSVDIGGDLQFTVTGTFSDGTTQNIDSATWTIQPAGIASIDSTGLAKGLAAGNATVTVSIGSVNDQTVLTVNAATLVSIAVTPSAPSVAKGTTTQLTAVGTFSDGSTQTLSTAIWTSDKNAVAVVDASGVVTGLSTGTANIMATSGNVSGSTVVTVTAAALTSLAVAPAIPSIGLGGNIQFTATGSFADGTTQDMTDIVTWSSSNFAIATVTSGGLATAMSKGSTAISASYAGVSDSTTMTVTAAVLASITLQPSNPMMAVRSRLQIRALGNYSDGSSHYLGGLIWSSSTPRSAMVNSSGLVRSKKSGSSTIRATVSGMTGSTTITITNKAINAITVTPANPKIAVGTRQQFAANTTFSDGTAGPDITLAVRWTTSSYATATVTSSGVATGVGAGSATVTASYNTGSSTLTDSTTLTVSSAKLLSIDVTPADKTVVLGSAPVQYQAMGQFDDGSTQNLTSQVLWSSSNASVVVMSNTGVCTTAGRGTATIRATHGSVTGSTPITVN